MCDLKLRKCSNSINVTTQNCHLMQSPNLWCVTPHNSIWLYTVGYVGRPLHWAIIITLLLGNHHNHLAVQGVCHMPCGDETISTCDTSQQLPVHTLVKWNNWGEVPCLRVQHASQLELKEFNKMAHLSKTSITFICTQTRWNEMRWDTSTLKVPVL